MMSVEINEKKHKYFKCMVCRRLFQIDSASSSSSIVLCQICHACIAVVGWFPHTRFVSGFWPVSLPTPNYLLL